MKQVKRLWFLLASSVAFNMISFTALLGASFFIGESIVWKGIALFLALTIWMLNWNYNYDSFIRSMHTQQVREKATKKSK